MKLLLLVVETEECLTEINIEEMSVIRCLLSVISCLLSVVCYQLSVISYQLSVV